MIYSDLTAALAFLSTLVLFSALKAMQNTLNTLAEKHVQRNSDERLATVGMEIAKSV